MGIMLIFRTRTELFSYRVNDQDAILVNHENKCLIRRCYSSSVFAQVIS